MNTPVYKLKQVVHNREGLEDFEGPLDLILFLLNKNKIEVQNIPVALILDQYLDYLEIRQQVDLEIASEFVAMASQLMFIKSRMLISVDDKEAQSEMEQLIQSLEERRNNELYQRIKKQTEHLAVMSEFGRNIHLRTPEAAERGVVCGYDLSIEELAAAYREVELRQERIALPPIEVFSEIIKHETYPVVEKVDEIMEQLRFLGKMDFDNMFHSSRSRSEVVATFIALLELCKNRMIQFVGNPENYTVIPIGSAEDIVSL